MHNMERRKYNDEEDNLGPVHKGILRSKGLDENEANMRERMQEMYARIDAKQGAARVWSVNM